MSIRIEVIKSNEEVSKDYSFEVIIHDDFDNTQTGYIIDNSHLAPGMSEEELISNQIHDVLRKLKDPSPETIW